MSSNTRPEVALIIGGGTGQLDLVLECKKMGLETIVTDMFPNPPAKIFADKFHQINTRDIESTIELARKENVNLVVSDQSDAAMPTVAAVAESLDLASNSFDTTLKCSNKKLVRDVMRPSGIVSMPDCHFFDHPSELAKFLGSKNMNLVSLIVKPHNSQGSKGVAILDSEHWSEQIDAAYAESGHSGLLLEDYITGTEYSVECFVDSNTIYDLAITEKEKYPSNPCIDMRNLYLGRIDKNLERSLFTINRKIIQQLNITMGATHAEYVVSPENVIYLIEIACRGGGGSISSKIIPYLTKFSVTRGLIEKALGKEHLSDTTVCDYRSRFAIMRFFNPARGRLSKLRISGIGGASLLHFEMTTPESMQIQNVSDSRTRCGYFVVAGENIDAVKQEEIKVLKQVQFSTE